MAKKNQGGNQATTKAAKSTYSSAPSSAPMSSPMPTMRPDNFDSIVAAQMGGSDYGNNTGNYNPLAASGGADGSGGGAAASFNPFNFGILGILNSVFGGNKRNSGPSARNVPQPRPSVRQQGDQLIATRDMPRFGFSAGDSAPVPDYGPFNIRSFISTDPGNVMRNIMGSERNMAAFPPNQGSDGTAPTAPIADTTPNNMPATRPAWWPSYMPWPPPPGSPMGELAASGYSPSISNPQAGIATSQSPLTMGIGGIIRRR